VVPLIWAKTPVAVVQISPFAGVVGAAPGATFRPAVAVDEARVLIFPVMVPPVLESIPLNVFQSVLERYPLVVVLDWAIPMVPVVVMVPPVRGALAVMEVMLPLPVPNGPNVDPLIWAKKPEVVVQISPFAGVVGAAPCGRLRPAVVVLEANVFTFPVRVPPARGR
jgi:acetamidase/formamidase